MPSADYDEEVSSKELYSNLKTLRDDFGLNDPGADDGDHKSKTPTYKFEADIPEMLKSLFGMKGVSARAPKTDTEDQKFRVAISPPKWNALMGTMKDIVLTNIEGLKTVSLDFLQKNIGMDSARAVKQMSHTAGAKQKSERKSKKSGKGHHSDSY